MPEIVTEEIIPTSIWYKLTQNDTLSEIIGQRVYLVWAGKDSKFPYVVHRLDDNAGPEWHTRQATYNLDIWDYADTATKTYEILAAVKEVLDEAWIGIFNESQYFLQSFQPATNGKYFAVVKPWLGEPKPDLIIGRIYFDTGNWIPEDTEGVWHYATQWTIRFQRTPKEIKSIIGE